MFGAKFQKWMEIVRPRKKSNKNKNGSGNLVSQNTSNEYKGTVYQNETNISSPARRSEVSPIQNHNGRRGWQSPNQEIPISRLDYPVIKPSGKHIKTGLKEGSFSANTTQYHSNRPSNYLTTAPTTYYQMKEIDQSMMQANPQIIVTSKSSTSINNNSIHYNNTLHPPPLCYSTANSSSNELLDDKPKYLISSSSSSVSSAVIKNQNESNNNVLVAATNGKQQQNSESKYGKIQPINKYMSKYRFFSKNTSTIDRYNGNSSDDFCTSTTALHDAHSPGGGGKGKNINSDVANVANSNSIKCNNEINKRTARNTMGGQCSTLQPLSNAATAKIYRNGNGYAGATAAYSTSNNSLTPPPPPHHQTLQHGPNKLGFSVINHVSSPESAYSTGYSTDGNSPGGASYSPEYYINIRTGIHYFPKGNTTIDASSNRFKSGLNRIEEKLDEQQFSHKRTESFDFCRNARASVPQSQPIDSIRSKTMTATGIKSNCNMMPNPGMSPELRKNIVMASQFRTPSPSRQRCRIRTNPWFSSVDPEPFNIPTDFKPGNKQRRDRDSGDSATSSSGIKSNSDESNEKLKGRKNQTHLSDSESSSSTEKPSKTLISLTEFRRKYKKETSQHASNSTNQHGESDDDATLNEIGKFDESYVYEKENDFLSDSDRTDCVSDLGQEAGDECDTDDLLDVEYIDKSIKQEIEKSHQTVDKKKQSKLKTNNKSQENQPKKRKKLLRKRSKNSESSLCRSPIASNRGCRSVGGTPVSIRRNEKAADRRQLESSLLSNRSNSLTFSEVHLIHSRMLAISESEKALIKADLEADVKYRQLIHEAESILISMKSNATPKEIPQTVISSPRRVCNVPTNKRVEMLRNCEVDLKRELSKTSTNKFIDAPPTNAHSIINKRLEMLRYETSVSAPSSPKTNRVAPIKTHVTNFIYQNEIELVQRREPSNKISPKKSPNILRRRFLTPKQDADSDSESDNKSSHSRTSGKENCCKQLSKIKVENEPAKINPQMISFRSVVCNNAEAEDLFFPQSEPLKRKIYSCNSTIDKIQRSLDFDSELPRKALLQKIQILREERQAGKVEEETATELTKRNTTSTCDTTKAFADENIKRKLIMKTIEDIKRSLEDQSLELNELHDSDN